ncbi:MAG TPA: hypothetical protein VK895_11875 [Jiangellaceae bacterium]|nr:hypothetical protein [Jiangellaceae bacterium]
MTRKNRNVAAGVLAFALSLVVAPAALAEPFEGEQGGQSTATVDPASGWEQNKGYLEHLERQQPAEQSSTTGTSQAQLPKAQVEYLERQAAAAAEATDDSGPGWLLGAGVIAAVAIGSVVVAVIRSRRPETAEPPEPAEREREKATV